MAKIVDLLKVHYSDRKYSLIPLIEQLLEIAEESDRDGEPFEEKMARLTSELSDMFAKSHELEDEIRRKLGVIGYEI